MIAADEDVEPALRDHWDDVCAAFHDTDAHHLYVAPDGDHRRRSTRAQPLRLSSISGSQPIEFRAQAAEFAARSLREAEPELEKLTRSGYTTLVTWPQRGQGERAAYNLAAPAGRRWDDGARRRASSFAEANLRDGFVAPPLKLAAIPEHRLIHRRGRVERPTRRGPRRCCARSPTCAPATSSSTRTTGSRASPASTPRPSPASPATT